MLYKGKAYKLDDVDFIIPKESNNKYKYLEPWIIKSKDESINLTFTPILDRHDNVKPVPNGVGQMTVIELIE